MKVSWASFKDYISRTGSPYNYVDLGEELRYEIWTDDGRNITTCVEHEPSGSETADQSDWEQNFLAGAKSIHPRTEAGVPAVGTAKMPDGWAFQQREVEFQTGKLDSIHDRDKLDVDHNDHTLKFYRADNTEITAADLNQPYLDANCVRTDLEWSPSHHWGIRAAYCSHTDVPNEAVYGWIDSKILLPSPPYPPGIYYNWPFADGGFNFEFVAPQGRIGASEDNFINFKDTDGLIWTFRHSAGFNHRIQCVMDIIKPQS